MHSEKKIFKDFWRKKGNRLVFQFVNGPCYEQTEKLLCFVRLAPIRVYFWIFFFSLPHMLVHFDLAFSLTAPAVQHVLRRVQR